MFYCELIPGLSISDYEYAVQNKHRFDLYISCDNIPIQIKNCIELSINNLEKHVKDEKSYIYNKKIINNILYKLKKYNVHNLIEKTLHNLKSVLLFCNTGYQKSPSIAMWYLKQKLSGVHENTLFHIFQKKSKYFFIDNYNNYTIYYKNIMCK